MNPLQKKIGIIGGGQLGKMMTLEAKKMGFYVAVLDPAADCPCHSICDLQIVAAYDDQQAYRELAMATDVLTYEFEHIDALMLLELEIEGFRIYQSPKSLINIQNKFIQKNLLKNSGISVGDFMKIDEECDLFVAEQEYGYPYFLKTTTDGYDGKGNYHIVNFEKAKLALDESAKAGKKLMAERFVDFSKEISVLAARAIDGSIAVYPVAENIHIDSILYETSVPAKISDSDYEAARSLAKSVMTVFEGVGMFCVELFVLKDGGVLVNEVAPRPHNSGHYTIEACYTSQFEQHIRAITALPLGNPELLCPAIMRNIIGPKDFQKAADYTYEGIEELLRISGLSFHNYAKGKASKGRKLGHFTVLASSLDEARRRADEAESHFKVKGV